jgi:CrcB protein
VIALAVGAAGGIGAMLRFVLDGVFGRWLGRRLPWATLVINVTGSFLLGLLSGLVGHRWELVLGTGLCGGYTTFGTACWESAELRREGRARAGGLYAVGTLAASLAAAAIGLAI